MNTLAEDAFVPDAKADMEALSNQSIRERTDAELEALQQESDDAADPYVQQEWWTDDFEMNSGRDGKRYLSPKRAFVNALIDSAPKRMDRALEALPVDDMKTCAAAAVVVKDLSNLLEIIDQYQAQQLSKYFALQAARQAARAASLRHSAAKWLGRLKPGVEQPEKLTTLINNVSATAKTGAAMLYIARQLSPDLKIDYRQACWETARINAFNIQKRVIDPTAASAHEKSASSALLDAC